MTQKSKNSTNNPSHSKESRELSDPVASSIAAARLVQDDNQTLRLTAQAFDAFIAECESPKTPNEALRALMARL